MAPKHTIVVVPKGDARLQQRRLSTWEWLLVTGLLVGAASFAVVSAWTWVEHRGSAYDVALLEQENERVKSVNRALEEDLRYLQSELAEYERRTTELAVVAGVELTLDMGESGVGGAPEKIDLDQYTDALDKRLDTISSALEARAERTASIPSIAPAKGLLTSSYGYRRDPITGTRTLHRGIDIGTAPNRPVRATADGIVIRAGRNGALGTSVSLSHGLGVVTRYGHMSRLVVEPGQSVSQGDVVGYVGKSGRATGFHLHYEVRVDGRPVNPLDYVQDGLTGP